MITSTLIAASAAVITNIIYFKFKGDKLLFPILSAFIFTVILSVLIYSRTSLINYAKIVAVLSMLHICGTNDIIRHQSDNIFPVLIIAVGLIKPTNLIYMLISFAVITIMFIIIIIMSKQTIGGGDIKMICALSFFFGIYTTIIAMIIACLIGITFSIIAKFAAKLPDFNKRYPFLPPVEAGFLAALLLQLY